MSWDKVRKIVEETVIGWLATDEGGQPRVRPMSFVLTEDRRLWSSTYRRSGKIAQLEKNARVEVCFMGKDYVQLRVAGRVDLGGGEDKKRRLLELNPKVRRHFADEKAPEFVHLEIVPDEVRFKPAGFNEYTAVA